MRGQTLIDTAFRESDSSPNSSANRRPIGSPYRSPFYFISFLFIYLYNSLIIRIYRIYIYFIDKIKPVNALFSCCQTLSRVKPQKGIENEPMGGSGVVARCYCGG